jgi:hypothetical protein
MILENIFIGSFLPMNTKQNIFFRNRSNFNDFNERFPPFMYILHKRPIYVNKQMPCSMKKIFI